jgi:hypothetical protein
VEYDGGVMLGELVAHGGLLGDVRLGVRAGRAVLSDVGLRLSTGAPQARQKRGKSAVKAR